MTNPRSGMTLVETVMVVVMVGLLTLVGLPPVRQAIQSDRARRAATVVALDLEQAFTLASRQRRPVTLACDCANARYTIADQSAGTVYLRRSFAGDADFRLSALTFSASPITIYPRGVASAPVTVTVAAGPSSHQITLTTAGVVRITQ